MVAVGIFTAVVTGLGIIILLSRGFLVPSGDLTIQVNGERELKVPAGDKLLNVLTVTPACTCRQPAAVAVPAASAVAVSSPVVASCCRRKKPM